MRKLILYCAISLNGKIARPDGQVDWLETVPNPGKSDYGFYAFYDSIDTTIQGFNTYDLIMSWGVDFPYPDKKNYVFTRKTGLADTEFVEFVSEAHLEFTRKLKAAPGRDIWLIGGGQINTLLLNAGLVDELYIHIIPIVIPEGIELFEQVPEETLLQLLDEKKYKSGVVELRYQVTRRDG